MKKCLRILTELYKKQSITNEGSFDERVKRYEERSNPILSFVEDCCDEIAGENTSLRNFTNECNEYLKSKHLRILTAKQVGSILRNEGFCVGNRKVDDISMVVIVNLKIKNYRNYQNYQEPNSIPHGESTLDLDSFNSYNSFKPEKQDNLVKKEEKDEELPNFDGMEEKEILEWNPNYTNKEIKTGLMLVKKLN